MATKGTPEIEQDIYDALETFFSTSIGGSLYEEDCRPLDSKAEDAVIIVSAAGAEQIQEGKAKINIYVPDIDNGSGHPVPDKDRAQEISKLEDAIVQTLNDADTGYLFGIDKAAQVFVNRDNKQHFVSISLTFQRITF